MCLVVSGKKYEFLMGDDGWTIMGGGSLDYLTWNVASMMSGASMSRFIIGKEALVHSKNRHDCDKDLWYFQSPLINLGFRPTLLMFSMMSFAGNFQYQNDVNALVRLRFDDDSFVEFPVYERYDGNAKTFYVQFIKELWRGTFNEKWYMRQFTLEILGDWTKGWETIGLDNVEII